MAVIRVNKTSDYTVMSNTHLREKEMSLKAKGLLSLMLSLPEEWDYSINGLCAICRENQTAIKSTLKELRQFGYLVITKRMPNETETGRIEYEYSIYEKPQKQAIEKQEIENLPIENQGVENQGQLSTDESITKKKKTKKINTKDITSEFEILWKLYPNKKGKDKALSSYIKARESGESKEKIETGIKNYAEECKIKKTPKQFIQHGSTWFGNSRWNDEYDLTPDASQQKKYGANGIAINQNGSDDVKGIF